MTDIVILLAGAGLMYLVCERWMQYKPLQNLFDFRFFLFREELMESVVCGIYLRKVIQLWHMILWYCEGGRSSDLCFFSTFDFGQRPLRLLERWPSGHLSSVLGQSSGLLTFSRVSLVPQAVKNLPEIRQTQVRSLGQEDPLEKGMATHSSMLAWRIPWSLMGYSSRGHKESNTTAQLTLWVTYQVWLMLLDFLCYMIKVICLHYRETAPFHDRKNWPRPWPNSPCLAPTVCRLLTDLTSHSKASFLPQALGILPKGCFQHSLR